MRAKTEEMIKPNKRGPNARFWEWINDGWVKVTIRPFQVLRWCHVGKDEEGWHGEWRKWNWNGEWLHCSISTDGTGLRRGRVTGGACWRCHILKLGYHKDIAALGPAWEECTGAGWQRDYAAEAMNY